MKPPRRRVLIVGAGMSGLTAAAYLLRGGQEVTILEKSAAIGGLVHSFLREGFVFDTGPRAIGNAGILRPMLADLGIEWPLVKGEVSLGIEGETIHFESGRNLGDYLAALQRLFPDAKREIAAIGVQMKRFSRNARWLNRVPNPLFKDVLSDLPFLFTRFLPLMPGFLLSVLQTSMNHESMERALLAPSPGQASLNDMVTQHFFKGTPAPFAFGYFENFQDYLYPLGGTGKLPLALSGAIEKFGGEIHTQTEIVRVNPARKTLHDRRGVSWPYDALLWSADLKSLYHRLDPAGLPPSMQHRISVEGKRYGSVKAGESVFTLFLAVDEKPEYFAARSKGHFIYTPLKRGLGDLHRGALDRLKAAFGRRSRSELLGWLGDYCRYNSYEISIPALKDPLLAPRGKTGLVASLLFDGELFSLVKQAGWYDEWKRACAGFMIDSLEASIYPGLRSKILFQDVASPVTLMERFNTDQGAITGWSMEERPPVPHQLTGLFSTPSTPIPDVFKAGQWSYSPSGVPIAILTGKVAARAILRRVGSRLV
ncbi:MAG: NAD(P)/FAD-dependent oxidoreductase [Spirochaetes bacterium]|nr:NAD(P)/FAD-dependent oxidoreductase [Spirochaetota bacterium]